MTTHRLALNAELPAAVDGKAPDWVELIPAGPNVVGRDGRAWLFDADASQAVLGDFERRSTQLPTDWEHATQHRAPKGEDAPAAAWIDRLEMRDGALWAHVEWTPRALEQVVNREYRFLSPVFDYDPASTRIQRLVSAGLTNKPNFAMTALNQESDSLGADSGADKPLPPSQETDTVSIPASLLIALGLSEAAAIAAANQLKTATNSEQPSLERFVPRGDYDQLMARATNAEQKLKSIEQESHLAAVDAAIDEATKAGKIAPSSLEFYRASCSEKEGLERFKQFVASAPVIAGESGLDGKKPKDSATALNAEEKEVARLLGLSDEEFLKGRTGDSQ